MTKATSRHDTAVPRPGLAPDFWLLVVSLSAGLGTARLTQSPGAAHVVWPITATVVAGHVGASLARRRRASMGVVMAAGVLGVVLATVWGQLLSATRDAVPTLGTWRALVSRFDAAGAVIRSHPTPVPATSGVVLCIATGAGLVAVASRCIWASQEARRGGAALTLVPTFGLFCYTALLSSQVDRLPGVLTYVVAALAFVIVADHATSVGSETPSTGDVAVATRRLGAFGHASRRARRGAGRRHPAGGQPGPGLAQGGRPPLPTAAGEQRRRTGHRERGRRGRDQRHTERQPRGHRGAGHRPRRQPEGGTGQPHRRRHVRRPDPAADLLAGGGAHRLQRDGVVARPDHRSRRPELRPVAPGPGGVRPSRPPRARGDQDVSSADHHRRPREHPVAPAPDDLCREHERRPGAGFRRRPARRGGAWIDL